ncbi:uncharacterized protein LOC132922888 isoform X7 [Rhopalosiphum padi]|nr:uncharacterized protein LOC132922888 isoform X7 [Rhopalosiphum padi]
MMKKVMFDVGELKRSKLDCSEFLEFRKAVTSTLGEIMGYIKTKRKKSVKPDTMQIRNTPASLMTNSVSVAKVKTNTKKENIEHLLERSKLLNSYSPFFFKKKHPTSSTKFHSSGLPTKTSSHRKGAPPAHIRYEMTQTKHRQTNIDDKTAKPALMSIKNAATNSISVPLEKPKPTKDNLVQVFAGLKKLYDSKKKRDHLVQNYTDIPIGKPATMLINHRSACLTTNNNSLPLDKLKPKEENTKYLLDELRKQTNCETVQYKPTYTNTTSAQSDTISVKHTPDTLTTNNDSLPVEKLKNKKENIDDMLKKIINLKYSIIQYESTPPKPTMKSTKHAPALLTTQNVRMKRRPKSMRGKIFRLR